MENCKIKMEWSRKELKNSRNNIVFVIFLYYFWKNVVELLENGNLFFEGLDVGENTFVIQKLGNATFYKLKLKLKL